jgi:hypothetical protein
VGRPVEPEFAGAATLPELRGRRLQRTLLRERMRYAFEYGCDLAMMVAEAGSNSQRNAEARRVQHCLHAHEVAALPSGVFQGRSLPIRGYAALARRQNPHERRPGPENRLSDLGQRHALVDHAVFATAIPPARNAFTFANISAFGSRSARSHRASVP